MWKTLTGGVAAAMLALPLAAQDLDEARVRELVLETIRDNPEVVMEALGVLQERQARAKSDAAASLLTDRRADLEEGAPVLGNPEGDVTVVEFFDYNCPYCRRATSEVSTLIADDPGVRVVMREWPILGEGSVFAARAALAARKQDLYGEFHDALMALEGRAEEESVIETAELVGLDIDQLRTDMQDPEIDAHIERSMALTEALGLNGTPSFVIGEDDDPRLCGCGGAWQGRGGRPHGRGGGPHGRVTRRRGPGRARGRELACDTGSPVWSGLAGRLMPSWFPSTTAAHSASEPGAELGLRAEPSQGLLVRRR